MTIDSTVDGKSATIDHPRISSGVLPAALLVSAPCIPSIAAFITVAIYRRSFQCARTHHRCYDGADPLASGSPVPPVA